MKKLLSSLFIVFIFTGCSFLDLKNDLKTASTISLLNVTIDIQRQKGSQVVVALVDVNKSTVIDYRVVKDQNQISFNILPGKYKLYSFEDLDKNYKYSHDERITGSTNFILSSSQDVAKNITLTDFLVASPEEIIHIDAIVNNLKLDINKASKYNGTVMPVVSDIYSDENIHKGMWQPYSFIFEVPFGVFLEKEYDPNKKVVLFIHGISGAPKNFEYLVNNLDKSKYQAFYAYYPSGVSIYKVSNYLSRVLNELRIRYDFEDISVVAHSMGGLVSRNMLNVLSKENHDFIDTFITISSPLDGDKRANSGVKNSPIVMPVWRDMAYRSKFGTQLYKTPLSKKINYYLIFGVKSKNNDDGVVSIPTQLRLEAQKEAKIVRGYNETHMSILSSNEVSGYIYSILDLNY